MASFTTIRAFLALSPCDEALAELRRCLPDLRRPVERAGLRVSWVRPDALHCTLKFFGNLDPARVPAIEVELGDALRGLPPPPVTVASLGAFPSPRRPRVLFAGMVAPDLVVLQQLVEERLELLDYPREERPFHPHVTLGRIREGGADLTPILASYEGRRFGPEQEPVREIVLYESRPAASGTGMDYLARARIVLG